MRYERLAWWWLPLYVIPFALIGGLLTAGATYWDWGVGLRAGAFAAVLGVGGYFLMGVRLPPDPLWVSLDNTLLELVKVERELAKTEKRRFEAVERLAEAVDILGHAKGYLDHSPLEGVMVVSEEITEFFIELEKREAAGDL